MDVGILIFAIIQLYKKRYQWVFASIFILASGYLEINYGDGGTSFILFKHQISDTGLFLYSIIFIYSVVKYGLPRLTPLHKVILFFYTFIIVNSVIDVMNGVSLVDVLKYSRGWIYLSVVWISPNIYRRHLKGTLRILFGVILILTVLIIIQNITGNYWLARPISGDRGIKPSFYVMLFIPLLWFDVLKYKILLKWLFISMLLLSVIMNLKQTYILTILATFIVYLVTFKRENITYLIKYGIAVVFSSVILFVANDRLRERILESSTAVENVKDEISGNTFSFRLLHTVERFNYIVKEPLSIIRGIGFVHEENYKAKVFEIGLIDRDTQDIIQLDTGDIAWSIFFTRFGLLGTLIFLVLYVYIIRQLYIKAAVSHISSIFFAFLTACLFVTSLGNAVVAYSYFYLIPLMVINSIRFRT